jgi:hypothetical protein
MASATDHVTGLEVLGSDPVLDLAGKQFGSCLNLHLIDHFASSRLAQIKKNITVMNVCAPVAKRAFDHLID